MQFSNDSNNALELKSIQNHHFHFFHFTSTFTTIHAYYSFSLFSITMSDLYGKCLNPICRSSCQRFTRKILAQGEIAPVKCLNCDCFQYQHDWLATWDEGLNTHRYFDNNKYSNNSSTSASSFTSRLPSTHNYAPSASDVNKELNTEVYPQRAPPSRPQTQQLLLQHNAFLAVRVWPNRRNRSSKKLSAAAAREQNSKTHWQCFSYRLIRNLHQR